MRDRPVFTMGAHRKSAPGYSGDPSPTHPLPLNWGRTPPSSQNLHCTLQPNGAGYNGGLHWQSMWIGDIPSPYPT